MSETVINSASHHFTALDTANIGAGVTVGAGASVWLTQNATAISSAVLMITCAATLVFYTVSWFSTRRGQDIRKAEIEREIVGAMISKAETEEEREMIRRLIK